MQMDEKLQLLKDNKFVLPHHHSKSIPPASPAHQQASSALSSSPFRRLCLTACSLLTVVQLLLLHHRIFPLFTTRPTAASEGGSILLLLPQSNNNSEANNNNNLTTITMMTMPLMTKMPMTTMMPMAATVGNGNASLLHPHQRLPDFLIIGVRKGGTRALLDALSLHPGIRVARHEVHFFDNETNYARGPDWYRGQMPTIGGMENPGPMVIGEKTPAYFTGNLKVPRRVFALNPGMKLVLIVREPVTRTVSDFTQIQQTKRERHKPALDFERMSFVLPKGNSHNSHNGSLELNSRFKPIRNSLYADHLRRWLHFFPLEQFLVLDGDKFITNPLSQLRLVERFLGLPAAIRPDQLVYNRAKGFFCFRLPANSSANDNASENANNNSSATMAPHCLGQSKGRKQLKISAKFRHLLAHKFVEPNRRFFALLNRQFPGWMD